MFPKGEYNICFTADYFIRFSLGKDYLIILTRFPSTIESLCLREKYELINCFFRTQIGTENSIKVFSLQSDKVTFGYSCPGESPSYL